MLPLSKTLSKIRSKRRSTSYGSASSSADNAAATSSQEALPNPQASPSSKSAKSATSSISAATPPVLPPLTSASKLAEVVTVAAVPEPEASSPPTAGPQASGQETPLRESPFPKRVVDFTEKPSPVLPAVESRAVDLTEKPNPIAPAVEGTTAPEQATMAEAAPLDIQRSPPLVPSGPKTVVTKTSEKAPEVSVSEIPFTETAEDRQLVYRTSSHTSTTVSRSDTLTSQGESRVAEVVQFVKGLFSRLGDYEVGLLRQADLESYLQNIADERLIHMPRKGSDWDRVLRTAQFFGLQIWRFGEKVGKFAPESRQAAISALASCQLLLEIGHRQAAALLPAFMTLYELGLLVSQITQIPGIFDSTKEVKRDISRIYSELVALAGSISVHYRNHIFNLGPHHQLVTLNLNDLFGSDIDAIWASKNALYERIWHQNLGKKTYALGLSDLRDRLSPESEAFRHALYAELAEDLERAEDTCEWVKGDLVEFFQSNEKILTVTGAPGSGKTVLADWIEERLQRPINGTTYSVLLYTFPSDDRQDATILAFLKGLLFQLFERSVGNVQLYESLVTAFVNEDIRVRTHGHDHKSGEFEKALWKALQIGLNTFKKSEEPIVLLIDGFEEAAGGAPSAIAAFFKSLQEYVFSVKNVRTITFSRYDHKLGSGIRHITISEHEVASDIRSFLRQTLSRSPLFMELPPAQREKIIYELSQKAKGSFLWARLAGNYLLKYHGFAVTPDHHGYFHDHHHNHTHKAERHTPETLVGAATSISSDVGDVLLAMESKLDLKGDHHLRNLLSFMLVSDAPLDVADISDILAVDVTGHVVNKPANIGKLVARTVPDLVLVRDGRVRFKSSIIRAHLQKQLGKSLPPVKEAHYQLVLRLLLYVKLSIHSSVYNDPTVDELDDTVAKRLFTNHRLLGFVLSHWLYHFRASTQYQHQQNGNDLALSKDFRAVFPDTAIFSLLERHAWYHTSDLVARLTLTLRIREVIFTEKHTSVLQSLIVLGHVHLKHGQPIDGSRYFYRAATLGQVVLSRFSTLVISCTDIFLHATETITFTKRTEIVTYRETLIRYKIEVLKERYGAHSEIVIEWYKKLAALYVSIKEEHLSVLVYREIYEIILVRDGKDSAEVRDFKKFFGGLDVTLKDFETEKEVKGYGQLLLETAEDLDVTDVLYISILLRLAHSYEVDGKWHLAERVYISLWRKVSILSRTVTTVEVHTAKIQVALAYIAFLRMVKREQEASNILMVLWTEYEHYKFESEELIIYLRQIGVLFKAFGLITIAAGIFGKVWSWFKATGKGDGEEAGKTIVLITEVVEEITETTVSTTTTTTTTTETTEVVVRDVFITQYERCQKSKHVDQSFFKASLALINLLLATKNWGEAEVIVRQSLEISWKAILTADVKIKLTEHYSKEVVRLATRLAIIHKHQHQFDKAEQIYLRIYYAAVASLSFEDELFLEALSGLIGFYEEYHRHEKVIEIYIDLVDKYRKKFGAAHRLTIQALYILAAQYEILGRKEAYTYYIEIVTALNKGLKHCHHDAFKAAIILVNYYYIEKRWAELQAITAVLWETFLHHHEDHTHYHFTEEIVTLIYEKYIYTLEYHAKVDIEVLYEISVKYRVTVTKHFGVDTAIIIAALLALAKIAERTEKHQHEAVTIYEEIITKYKTTKTTTTVVTETTITTVKKRLSTLYVTIIKTGGGKAGGKDVGVSIDRAILISLEVFAQLKIEYGIWHSKTLAVLQDIIILYQKINTKESHAKLVLLLQTTVVEIISTLTVSVQLFEAATTLATIFVTVGLVEFGYSLLQQLHYQLIFGEVLPEGVSVKLEFKLPHTVNSRVVFLFVAAFEQQLRIKEKKTKTVASFSELLSSLLYEVFLYEEYRQVVDSKDISIESILTSGARLRGFWAEETRAELLVVLDAKLFPVFKARYPDFAKVTADEFTKLYYLALLAELSKDKADASYAVLACKAGNDKVRALLEAGEFGRALEVARFAFTFAAKQGFYRSEHARIAYGYKLAELLAGVDVRAPPHGDPVREKLLALSREVTAEVFAVLAAEKIDLATLEAADVAGLVRLLGAQADYARLEGVLLQLWQSREVRRSWRPATVLSIGFALVHAYAGQPQHKRLDRALDLADLLWYNLRRGRGWLDADAVRAAQLLGSLYVEAGRPADAMAVYESVLRQIEAASTKLGGASNGNATNGAAHTEDADGSDRALLALHARQFLELLAAAHARLGQWTKPKKEYHDLYEHLRGSLGLKPELPAAFDKWASAAVNTPDKNSLPGKYTILQDWRIEGGGVPPLRAVTYNQQSQKNHQH